MNQIKKRFSYMLKCAFVAMAVLLSSLTGFAQQNSLSNESTQKPDPSVAVTNVYARLYYDNAMWDANGENRADITVRFFSDYACTIPVSVTNVKVKYSWSHYDYATEVYQSVAGFDVKTGSGTEFILEENVVIETYHWESFYRIDSYVVLP